MERGLLLVVFGTLVVAGVSVGFGIKIASQTNFLAAIFPALMVFLLGIIAVLTPLGMEEGGIRGG
jgi:hypothetical protein